ncbi:MAG: hypothetical protein AAF928_07860 [Myxococcota bacterium]
MDGRDFACRVALLIALGTGQAEAAPDRDEQPAAEAPAVSPEPDATAPVEREGRLEGEAGRDLGNALLYIPRNTLDYLFRGTQAAANLVATEQLVPRYRRLLGIPDGAQLFVFPTFFAETGRPLSAGLRLFSSSRHVTTQQRFGFGGRNDVVIESELLFKVTGPVPMAISLEGFYELASTRTFRGVGITPSIDRRNEFRGAAGIGRYRERRVRYLASFGVRASNAIEVFLSTSVQRRLIRDPVDPEDDALTRVFDDDSLSGLDPLQPWRVYSEVAARIDTRATRGRPVPGVLVEAYGGASRSFEPEPLTFLRLGWRVQGFVPVYRKTNIISPRLVVDRIVRLDDLPVPFYEVPGQPDFRGRDNRRDDLSLVAGIDYAWRLVDFLNARTFIDFATVAPGISDFTFEQIKQIRYAVGAGLDVFSTDATLASLLVSTSPDGARLLFSLGGRDGFGDRQTRE